MTPAEDTDKQTSHLREWLLDLFEDMLFNPKQYENKTTTGGLAVDAAGAQSPETLGS